VRRAEGGRDEPRRRHGRSRTKSDRASVGFEVWCSRLRRWFPILSGCWLLIGPEGEVLATWSYDDARTAHWIGSDPARLAALASKAISDSKDRKEDVPDLVAVSADGNAEGEEEGVFAVALALDQPLFEHPVVLVFAGRRHQANVVREAIRPLAFALEACLLEEAERREAQKRIQLFEAVTRLLTKIDVDSVLGETLDWFRKLFPVLDVELWMSQERETELPVRQLDLQTMADNPCAQAFMNGTTLVWRTAPADAGDGRVFVAAPLQGRQGTYGVVKLTMPEDPTKDEVVWITRLAEMAGAAFENGRLYEQSNMLIHELRLINEITKQLNRSLKLSDVYRLATEELVRIFGAEYACIVEYDKEKERMVVQATNLPSILYSTYPVDYGFSGIVFRTKEPLIVSDYLQNPQVPSELMEQTGARSLIASPILTGNEVLGAILVAHRRPNFFSYDNFRLLQMLSSHIGLAMANAFLHAEMRRMAITDHLTGLYVRRYLDEQIEHLFRKDFCGALLLIDVDDFKRINDTYGHQVGDRVLIQISRIIRASVRDTDIPVRWGGEELAVYFPQVRLDAAVRIAERIRKTVETETWPKVTISCGVAEWSWESGQSSLDTLFQRADTALYRAKGSGKNKTLVDSLEDFPPK